MPDEGINLKTNNIRYRYPWGNEQRYYSYTQYIRQLFGGRVQKLTIDAGFSCPHRQGRSGSGGCTYCNNAAFNPSYCEPSKSVTQQLREGVEFHAVRYRRAKGYLAYFQAYTNTYAPIEKLRSLFLEAASFPGVVGLVVGTRPDCLSEEVIDLLEEINKRTLVFTELGVESIHGETLERVHRGHGWPESRHAIVQLAEAGLHVGVHLILGLPGEDEPMMLESIAQVCELPVNSLKLHQLQVLKGTVLAQEWAENPSSVQLFTLEGYMELLGRLVPHIPASIALERVTAEAPPAYLIAPHWGLIRNDAVLKRFEEQLERLDAWQGKALGAKRVEYVGND